MDEEWLFTEFQHTEQIALRPQQPARNAIAQTEGGWVIITANVSSMWTQGDAVFTFPGDII